MGTTHELRDFGQESTLGDGSGSPAAKASRFVAESQTTRIEPATVIDIRSGDVRIEVDHRVEETAEIRRLTGDDGLLGAGNLTRGVKRGADLVGATLLLLMLSPVLIGVALAVKLSSPGPVLYVSDRVGKDRRVFRFYKFRSMENGADVHKSELSDRNEVGGPVFKIRSDPRVTPVGRVIRKYSLDELPQLFNVIKGDMSLVGPRPPTVDEVEHYDGYQAQRLLVRPGLTCIWQVSGRSEIDFDEWVELDLDYIEQWSPLLDAKLLIATIPAVVSGRGAY